MQVQPRNLHEFMSQQNRAYLLQKLLNSVFTPQICHQHFWSVLFVTNINVVDLVIAAFIFTFKIGPQKGP